MVRITRVFRLLKLGKHNEGLDILKVPSYPTALPYPYVVLGTHSLCIVQYSYPDALLSPYVVLGTPYAMSGTACAMSGTDSGYRPTLSLCHVRYFPYQRTVSSYAPFGTDSGYYSPHFLCHALATKCPVPIQTTRHVSYYALATRCPALTPQNLLPPGHDARIVVFFGICAISRRHLSGTTPVFTFEIPHKTAESGLDCTRRRFFSCDWACGTDVGHASSVVPAPAFWVR